MKVAELLEKRRANWYELQSLCDQLQQRRKKKVGAVSISRFAALYRAACADLALADAYKLPPSTINYLHLIVGRAHNQLHRSRIYEFHLWFHIVFKETPRKIFNDRCVQASFVIFWSLFLFSAYVAYNDAVWPGYAEEMLGEEQLTYMEESFRDFDERPWETNFFMACHYISHNTGIGLQCFASSLLLLPGLLTMGYNAAVLGASFGYMFRPDVGEAGDHFKNFVTAHGPFELTAIVLSCGAGLRIGTGWLVTNGLTRAASLKRSAVDAMPMVGAMIVLFCMAAFIEGFISPTMIPWPFKAAVAVISSFMLMFYFVILGFPRGRQDGT